MGDNYEKTGRRLKGFLLAVLLLTGCTVTTPPAEPEAPSPLVPTVRSLYIDMQASDLEALYARDPWSDDPLPGSFRRVADGLNTPLHSIRFRGSSSRGLPKKSFNIRFREPQDFLFGSDRMNLNAMFTDPSMMRERLAFGMFETLGQPASRTAYFNLYLNGSYEGLYIHIERVDSDLLRHAGLNHETYTLVRDGFRGVDGTPASAFGFDLSTRPDPAQSPADFLSQNFDSRGNPDWAALAGLVQWVYETPVGPAYAAGFAERIDLNNFIDWLAIHFIIGDIDSFGNDYWLYLDHATPGAKWHFIPWDKDLSFGSHTRIDWGSTPYSSGTANDYFAYEYPLLSGWDNQLIAKFLATDALRERLYARLETLMQEVFTPRYFSERIDAIATGIRHHVNAPLSPGARHPQNHFGELGRFDEHLELLQDYVALRYGFIGRWIHPVEGPLYAATVHVSGGQAGDTIHFTDARGWTVASLRLTEDAGFAGAMTVSVAHAPNQQAIDRVWTVQAGEQPVNGELSLYYRNDDGATFGLGNWYASSEPVGEQRSLRMALVSDEGELSYLDSRVNPFSNKVTARLSLSGTQQLVLGY